MAARDGKEQRTNKFRRKLEELECPYIEGVDDSWVEELLFKPGEPRIRLLEWLLSRFDPDVSEVLESTSSLTEGRNDSRLQRILFVANLLGLCRSDDVELIRGSASKRKQAGFIEDLLDLVSVVDKSDMNQHFPHPSTPRKTSTNRSLDDQFVWDCWYVDALCREEVLSEVFKSRVQLFPADMARHFPKDQLASNAVADNKHLVSVAEQLTNELNLQTKQLKELKEKYPLCSANPHTVQQISTKLGLSLSTLSQVVNGFLHCYGSEMKPWSNRTQPVLTEIGPHFQRVHGLLTHLTKAGSLRVRGQSELVCAFILLDSLILLKSSYTHLRSAAPNDQKAINTKDMGPATRSAIESLQDCVNVLQESIARQQERSAE